MAGNRRYPPEVRERAVRLVFENEEEYASRWETIRSIAAKFGCSPETLRSWIKQVEIDSGRHAGLTTEERSRNEILRQASAFFAQAELDRQPK